MKLISTKPTKYKNKSNKFVITNKTVKDAYTQPGSQKNNERTNTNI